jgi:hypothetical protein
MTILNYTKNQMVLLLTGSSTSVPNYLMIGSGSGTVSTSDTTLFAPTDRQAITTLTYPTSTSIQFQGDWNSVEMSGTRLTEFGMCASGTALTGSMWSKINFPGVTFDGTNELRVLETWRVY